jgi:23S rRNA (adenine2503-C2)-methyltransferase
MTALSTAYDAPGLNVSMSTVAPKTPATGRFFENLIRIKESIYPGGRFQLQFSIHTTDLDGRDDLIPFRKWSFDEIAAYGERFSNPPVGDKKVTLNFAPPEGYPVDALVVRKHFDPDKFMIKLTPLNPTVRSREQSLSSAIDPHDRNTSTHLVESFKEEGFDVILSIGELEENKIGSNCGQFIQRAMSAKGKPEDSYLLDRYRVNSSTI